jgi:hypothetical protein
MATIEPRLIHLLNDSTTPQLQRADLPPRHNYAAPQSSDRLLPLEPNSSHLGDNLGSNGQLATSSVAPLHPPAEDGSSTTNTRNDAHYPIDSSPPTVSNTKSYPLRLLLCEDDSSQWSSSLSQILDDTPDCKEDISTKKRHRAIAVKDDFVQLPQPVKKQKQQLPMPPILNGLHEPPPDAALFPPITSGSDDAELNQLVLLQKSISSIGDVGDRIILPNPFPVELEKTAIAKSGRKRTAKPRRKWTDEETKHLLLGVNRHGVGKWTSILDDPDFKFNDRTAGDLKDRFRTCCPDELRAGNKTKDSDSQTTPTAEVRPRAKTGLLSENILIETEDLNTEKNDSDSGPKQKKSRAHRKKMEDLAELGIHGPFKKSHRRERRPFTEQDDKEILEGLDSYGPAWTKIQRDARFNLGGRQPTDLRDRVRNKYPAIYQRIEKGAFQVTEPGRSCDTLEPSVTTMVENSLSGTKSSPLEPQLDRSNSKDEMPKFPLSVMDPNDSAIASPALELPDGIPSYSVGNNGEMDISRLLLDDSTLYETPTRLGMTDGQNGSAITFNGIPEVMGSSGPERRGRIRGQGVLDASRAG